MTPQVVGLLLVSPPVPSQKGSPFQKAPNRRQSGVRRLEFKVDRFEALVAVSRWETATGVLFSCPESRVLEGQGVFFATFCRNLSDPLMGATHFLTKVAKRHPCGGPAGHFLFFAFFRPRPQADRSLHTSLECQVKRANKETPAALFRSMGGWSGAGAITPMAHAPGISHDFNWATDPCKKRRRRGFPMVSLGFCVCALGTFVRICSEHRVT